jgi:hypothetical protein
LTSKKKNFTKPNTHTNVSIWGLVGNLVIQKIHIILNKTVMKKNYETLPQA